MGQSGRGRFLSVHNAPESGRNTEHWQLVHHNSPAFLAVNRREGRLSSLGGSYECCDRPENTNLGISTSRNIE
jgi:hypothetical protein